MANATAVKSWSSPGLAFAISILIKYIIAGLGDVLVSGGQNVARCYPDFRGFEITTRGRSLWQTWPEGWY